ncbi:MAG TPA: hypothetical protein VLT88_10510 [Desulfosarcina sp.]|nr:hypothetical protein [Desulfosarcina sp.]
MGMKNLFRAEIRGKRADLGGVRLSCGASGDGPYWVAIRPENVAVSCRPVGHGASNRLQGRLQGILNRGIYADVQVAVGGLLLHAIDSRRELLRANL